MADVPLDWDGGYPTDSPGQIGSAAIVSTGFNARIKGAQRPIANEREKPLHSWSCAIADPRVSLCETGSMRAQRCETHRR